MLIKNKSFSKDVNLFNFLLKLFFKTKIGIIIAEFFPIMFMVIYYVVYSSNIGDSNNGSDMSMSYFVMGLPSYIVLSIIPLSFITLPQIMVELKNSILLRRIKTSGVKKEEYLLIIFVQYFILSIISCLITFLIFLAFVNTRVKEELRSINFGNLIYSTLMLILSSITLGMMIGSILKNVLISQLIGTGLFMITMMFGGLMMPINVFGEILAIKIITLFSPINYATGLVLNSGYIQSDLLLNKINTMTGSDFNALSLGYDIFDINTPFKYPDADFSSLVTQGKPTSSVIIIYDKWQKVLNLLMPYLLTITFSISSYFKFSWYGR